MYLFYLDGVQLPVSPGKLQIKVNNQNKTATLINEGEINILKTPGLTDVSFTFLIPNQKYPFAKYPDGYKAPSYYLNKIEELKVKGKVFKFNIIRRLPNGKAINLDSSMNMTVESYTITEDHGNGLDMSVDINLKQYRAYGTKTITIKKTEAKTTEKRDTSTKPVYKTHTVKSGDTLWAIAQKYLGNGTKYTQVYSLNKDLIEKTAQKYGRKSSSGGHWIYPGTVLNIPN